MKHLLLIPLLLTGSFLLTGCLKEKLDPDAIYGSWQYDAVQFTGSNSDSTAPIKGIFKFEKTISTYNAGGTVYGDFCIGTGDFPILQEISPGNDQLFQTKIDFSLTKSGEPSNYNYLNFYNGTYGYLAQGLNHYGSVRMSLVSKDEINIRFERSQNSYIRFNIQQMKLRKI